MKYIVSNFNSWKRLNEAESPGRTKQTAGIGQKIVGIPIDETSFKVKIVHDLDVLDTSGKMTPQGWKAIYDWLIAQPRWPLYYTGLKDMTNNFVIYSVNKDNDRKQLITFVIVPRTSAPGLPATTQIARQEDLATMIKDPQKVTILDQQTQKAENTKVNTDTAGSTASKPVKLTTPLSFDDLKTVDSSNPLFNLIKSAYLEMQKNASIKKLMFFDKLKAELKSGSLGDNSVLLMKGIIAGFTINDEYGDSLDQVNQTVVDKLALFVPAAPVQVKKNESTSYFLGIDGKRLYEQATTDPNTQVATSGNLPAGFNLVAFSKAVGGAPAAAVTTGDIKVPSGGFKKGSVAKGDAELKKVQQLIIDKFAKKLAAKPIYQKFKGFGADGNWGPTTEKMVAYLQGGFKLTVDGTVISPELINKIQTNKIDESYLGLNYRIVEQFDMDAADSTEKTYKSKSSTGKSSTGETTQTGGDKWKTAYSNIKKLQSRAINQKNQAGTQMIWTPVPGGEFWLTQESKSTYFKDTTANTTYNGKATDDYINVSFTDGDKQVKIIDFVKDPKIVKFNAAAPAPDKADFTDETLTDDVDWFIDKLDPLNWMDLGEITEFKQKLSKYKGKFALDDDDEDNKKTVPALKRISQLYARDEEGDTLYKDLNDVGTKSMGAEGVKIKTQILKMLAPYKDTAA